MNMRKLNKYLCFVTLMLAAFTMQAQDERALIRDGNELFSDSLFKEAEEKFTEALSINPNSTEASYNLANTYYAQGNYEAAKKIYETLNSANNDKLSKDQLLHNIGNTEFKLGNYEEAVKNYKKSLISNPSRSDTRYNLAMAKKAMENDPKKDDKNKDGEDNKDKDQKNKDDQNKDQENKDNESKDGEGDQDKKDGKDSENKDEKNKDDSKKEGDDKKDQEGKPDEKEGSEGDDKQDVNKEEALKKGELSKEQAEQLLRSVEDKEQELQEKMIQMQMKRKKATQDKDW